jgi:hypothetical protein
MNASSNRPSLPDLPSEVLAFTPATRAAITRYAMRAVDEALAAAPVAQPPAVPPFSELARLTQWLDTKFSRHGEQEDADASKLLHTLWRAALATQPPAPVQQTEAGDVCKWCCGTGRFSDHECRFCATRWIFGATAITPPAPALPPVAMVPLTEALVLEMADFLRELCKHSDAMVPIQGPRSDIASGHYERARHLIARSAHGIEASTGEQSHG